MQSRVVSLKVNIQMEPELAEQTQPFLEVTHRQTDRQTNRQTDRQTVKTVMTLS